LSFEVGVAESNGVVRIVAKHSELAVSEVADFACALKCGEKTMKLCQLSDRQNFGTHYRKSMPLRTTVTTDFRCEVEMMPFLRNAHVQRK